MTKQTLKNTFVTVQVNVLVLTFYVCVMIMRLEPIT